MSKPLIQIDNDLREMTDEEFASYQEAISCQSLTVLETQNDVNKPA